MLQVIKYFYGQVEKMPKEHKQQFWAIKSKPVIQCHPKRKEEKKTGVNHNRAKQVHINTVDSMTHLKDAQCIGRDVRNVARWITIEQYAEAWDTKQSLKENKN